MIEVSFFIIISSFVFIYVLITSILSKYPCLLKNMRKNTLITPHISHRGGAGEFTENTIGAFKRALEYNTDMLECDVHLTKDDVVVITHDSDLTRAFGKNISVGDLNYVEIPRYKECLEVTFHPGHVCQNMDENSRRIAKLEDFFINFPDTPVNIDVKIDSSLLIEKVNNLILKYKRENITIWGSFSSVITDKLKKENPEIPLFFPFNEVMKLAVLFHLGILPFLDIHYEYMELPLQSVAMARFKHYLHMLMALNERRLMPIVNFLSSVSQRFNIINLPDIFKSLQWKFFRWFLYSDAMFNHLRARGIPVYLWVCNTEEQLNEAFSSPIDGVMTDFPSLLCDYLNRHPKISNGKTYPVRRSPSSEGDCLSVLSNGELKHRNRM